MNDSHTEINYGQFSERMIWFYNQIRNLDLSGLRKMSVPTQYATKNSVTGPSKKPYKGSMDLLAIELRADFLTAIRDRDWRSAFMLYISLSRIISV